MKTHDKIRKAQLLKEWQSTGQSKSGFATRHGIGHSTFYHWTKNLKSQSSINQPPKGFQSITIKEDISIPGKPTAIIHYPSGIKLELYDQLDPRFVKALVE